MQQDRFGFRQRAGNVQFIGEKVIQIKRWAQPAPIKLTAIRLCDLNRCGMIQQVTPEMLDEATEERMVCKEGWHISGG